MGEPRKQCKKCPWKVSTNPFDIPNGYDEDLHRKLSDVIAEPASLVGLFEPVKMMACHETRPGVELPCIGFLANQIGPGNNLALRLAAATGQIDAFELDGPQHECFADTLPENKEL